jgi:uncharacterized membrane protein
MTPKQEERIRNKIARIRKELAADKKAMKTFFANNYLFDKFLGRELITIEKGAQSNWETAAWLFRRSLCQSFRSI